MMGPLVGTPVDGVLVPFLRCEGCTYLVECGTHAIVDAGFWPYRTAPVNGWEDYAFCVLSTRGCW